jgi:outer membrane protein OmpA-like peptidoglycan-associated protein
MQRLILTLMACSFIAGCAPKSTFVLLPDPDGQVGKIIVTNSQGTQTLNQARQSVVIKSKTDSPSEVKTMDEREIHSLFGKALDIQPLPPAKFLLYFKPESAQPKLGSESEISKIMQTIKDRHSMDISVNGHTDRKGEAVYNYELSFQRARRVQKMLEKEGVDPSFITTTSHGKNNPLVPTADNVPEPRNRRVEVIVR